jgi:hypothetical protein
MINESIVRLQTICARVPPLLRKIPEREFTFKPAPGKWSKKEILGHLIDSATNNHQRFVRAQFESSPAITYDQMKWNQFSYHNQMNSEQLIQFWMSYNLQLVALIQLMPGESFDLSCQTGGEKEQSLAFVFIDYVQHLEHHLRQIIPGYD